MSLMSYCVNYVVVSSVTFLPFTSCVWMSRRLVSLVKVLCLWLLLHFLLHTWTTYGIGFDIPVLRAWKEIVIWLLILSIGYGFLRYKKRSAVFSSHYILPVFLVTLLWIWGTLLIHLLILDGVSITRWAMAMRYDYLGFILLLLGRGVTLFLDKEDAEKLLKRYGRIIKWVLLGALVWWCIVAIKPWTLKVFWFNNYVFEWTVGMQPPAVYYTHINYWLPRSQFRFERPTTFWFWLTAFFPLFFMQFLARRPWQETRAWRTLYWLNIVVTFSRAAWWSRIIAVVLCIWLTSVLPWKKLLLRYGLPLFLLFAFILFIWREQIALRWYSNYGHVTMVKQGRTMLMEKPLRWWGGASAWPWSHRDGWLAFNPENQFLQILIEFWKIGSLPWLVLRWWTIWIGVVGRFKSNQWVMAFSLGMITLTISGMVLHSFADRMVVYPFMLLFGIALWTASLWKKSQIW